MVTVPAGSTPVVPSAAGVVVGMTSGVGVGVGTAGGMTVMETVLVSWPRVAVMTWTLAWGKVTVLPLMMSVA